MTNRASIIGANIYKLRKRLRLSQPAFAQKIGVVKQTVSRWENGQSEPDENTLDLICEKYDISLDELTAGVVESGQKTSETGFSKEELREIVKTEVRSVLGDELTGLKAVLGNLLSNDLLPAAIQSITDRIVEAHAAASKNRDVLCQPPPNNRVKEKGQ